MRVAQALAMARAQGVDRLDAQLLLAHRLQRPRSWLIAHDDEELDAEAEGRFAADLARRAEGVPLAYLVGEREFRGLSLAVTPAVLVPRPDTETLVEWALECLAGRSRPRVLDLGTGSGAIAIGIARARLDAVISATDVDPEAVAVARANAARHGASIEFLHGSWWEPVAGRRFDLVLSNPPYIAESDPHLPALRHEPQRALTSGADGLDALRELVAGAAAHLEAGGQMLVEHGAEQGTAVRALFAASGLRALGTRRDLGGRERCTGAALAGP
ncbi:MAG: peptide chain release factor N(5)-glutamine methyltransferase [Burkholderiales bacterium]|nr:peptide chain release factor N(5)-glutamine methyltransferase [Burkholderiales bacterium]